MAAWRAQAGWRDAGERHHRAGNDSHNQRQAFGHRYRACEKSVLVKPYATGRLTEISVVSGTEVTVGTVIAKLESEKANRLRSTARGLRWMTPKPSLSG